MCLHLLFVLLRVDERPLPHCCCYWSLLCRMCFSVSNCSCLYHGFEYPLVQGVQSGCVSFCTVQHCWTGKATLGSVSEEFTDSSIRVWVRGVYWQQHPGLGQRSLLTATSGSGSEEFTDSNIRVWVRGVYWYYKRNRLFRQKCGRLPDFRTVAVSEWKSSGNSSWTFKEVILTSLASWNVCAPHYFLISHIAGTTKCFFKG